MEKKRTKTKKQIVKSLGEVREDLEVIINNFGKLDSGDNRTDRLATNQITFTLFAVVDKLIDTEVNIYNFLKRRQDGLHIKKGSKEGTREHK